MRKHIYNVAGSKTSGYGLNFIAPYTFYVHFDHRQRADSLAKLNFGFAFPEKPEFKYLFKPKVETLRNYSPDSGFAATPS
jgi:hypothetical protein